MTTLYQVQQIRRLESLAYSEGIDTEMGLMNKAGEAAFRSLRDHWPKAKSVLIVAGKGNNAGDGFVLARQAKQFGLKVDIVALTAALNYQGPAKQALDDAMAAGINFQEYRGELSDSADIVVDALLGIGISGEVSDPFKTVIEQINAIQKPVLAIDAPSGLDVNTGSIMGAAVKADLTVTFIALKQGLLTHHGCAQCGKIVTDDLQLPKALFQKVSSTAELINWDRLSLHLAKRRRDGHKGRYGHVLIIGGDYGMGGAVRMAAEGALRVGAGLVTVATRPEHVPVVNVNRPEIMCHQVTSSHDLTPLLKKATVVVIGPGLGKTDWAKILLDAVLQHEHPKVLDADALNLLSQFPQHCKEWILTPHPGEAARLLSADVKLIQTDRFGSVKALQKKYGGVIVLKGAGSIVQTVNKLPQVCSAGNPGMASGGMGDVLSGVIGGLAAQKLSIELAAEIGVMAHAMAADRAAEAGGERGLLATDLMDPLRQLVNPE